jgi:excisionase family DNA binding protein
MELQVAVIAFRTPTMKDMGSFADQRFDPSEVPQQEVERLQRALEADVRPVLVTDDGDTLELPKQLNDLFLSILDSLRRREVVFLMHQDEAFTTQASANFLGVSRQFLIRLLDQDAIPFHRVGTHRRVFFKDLLAYKESRSKVRKAKLDEMTDKVVRAGMDEKYVDLTRSEDD